MTHALPRKLPINKILPKGKFSTRIQHPLCYQSTVPSSRMETVSNNKCPCCNLERA